MSNATKLVFSTERYDYLATAMAALAGFEIGELERHTFADGERYRRLISACADRDVILVGGTVTDDDTLELYDLACAISYYGARRLTVVIPYFGYSTMERAVLPGEVVTAKTRARLLSSIPAAAMGNQLLLVDLHVEGLTHYFERDIHPMHVYAKRIIIDLARRFGGDDFVLACTDAGRAKWVESLASDLGVSVAFVYKRRSKDPKTGSRTEVTGVSAHVAGKNVIIYDDMIRTGGSLIGAAQAYHDAGAASISAICTHGLFCGGAIDRLRDCNLFTAIACTDTHPAAVAITDELLTVESVAPILCAALKDPS